MRNIKSILLGVFVGTILLLAILIATSYFYEDEVSQYLIEELNEHILSEIEVEDVNFSLIKKFPKASIEFKNVVAYSKEGFQKNICGYNTDTLFFAQSIYVQADFFDLIQNEMTINSIHFDKGKINLFVDHLGDPNYIFWKKSKKDSAQKDFKIELKQVRITDSKLIYCNNATNLIYSSGVNKVDLEGNFSTKNYLLKVKADQIIKKLAVENIDYIKNKRTISKVDLDIIDDNINIKNGDLDFKNLKCNVNGNIATKRDLKIDLVISGKNLRLESFIKNLPVTVQNEFPNIIGQRGTVALNLSISGENIKVTKPHIEALFLLNDAQLFDMERDIRFSNVNIDGQFSNGVNNNAKTSKLTFKTFSANIERNSFDGSFELTNFSDPQILLNMKNELYFEDIKNVFKIDTIDVMKGIAQSNIKYKGNYSELKSFKFKDLFTKDYVVDIKVKDGSIKFKDNPVVLNDISGKISLNRTLYADSVYFKINDNDFLIDGRASKLFEYFNGKDIFNINARVYSRKVNLDDLAVLFKSEKGNSESFQFPEKLALQLRLNIENFEVGKFYATTIKGDLNYKPKMFSLHKISFNSMNGSVKAGGVIIQKFNNDFTVKSQSQLTNINMNKLFYSFNNFGQTFISSQNIEGNLTGDVYFASEWSDKIKIYKNSVHSECNIKIHNGGLNNFEPLMSLSRFIDVEELKNIKFSTLENSITIKDEQITIPQMDIESSALNITAEGIHKFNSEYAYHVRVFLSDLLSSKMRKSKHKHQDDENIEEDDEGRITLYLLLQGNEKDSKVKYDRKAARYERKASVKNEKRELKQILNDEFGWYTKDTTLRNLEKSNEQNDFEIEFEETKPKEESSKETKSDQKFIIEWEEDTTDTSL